MNRTNDTLPSAEQMAAYEVEGRRLQAAAVRAAVAGAGRTALLTMRRWTGLFRALPKTA